jgi:hypothetical protein
MCENGSYASATATSCIVCPPFQVGNDDGTGCTSMPGFYADDEGSVLGAPEGVRDDVSGMTATTLDLEKGYWRATESSTEVLPCLTENHCKGGAELSELCSEGYEGPLCAVCMDDYAATGSGADMQCKECTGSATATVAAGASVFIVVVGLFACVRINPPPPAPPPHPANSSRAQAQAVQVEGQRGQRDRVCCRRRGAGERRTRGCQREAGPRFGHDREGRAFGASANPSEAGAKRARGRSASSTSFVRAERARVAG